jgi:hypothetical protein
MTFSWFLSMNKLRFFRLALLLPSSIHLTASKSGKILTSRLQHHPLLPGGSPGASAHTAKYFHCSVAHLPVEAN